MKFTVTLTAEDCLQARRLAMRPRLAMRIALYIVIALFTMAILWLIFDSISRKHPNPSLWKLLGIGAYFYAIFFLWMPFSVRRVFKQQKTLHTPIEMELTDTHFLTSSANGTFQMPWKDFHKWKKNDRMVLVYQSEAIMHLIPFRALPDQADQQRFIEILRQNLGPEKT